MIYVLKGMGWYTIRDISIDVFILLIMILEDIGVF